MADEMSALFEKCFNDAKVSVVHATLGRPQKAAAAIRMWMVRAKFPRRVEFVVALNASDPTGPDLMEAIEALPAEGRGEIRVIGYDVEHSAPAWNAGASDAKGNLLIQGQDDVEPPADWDECLLWRMFEDGHRSLDDRVVISVGDGYRKGDAAKLMCTAICTRAYVDFKGHFLYPGYRSVYSDDDFSYNAYRDERDGDVKIIRAPDLVFLHRHHYHDKNVPWDATYAHENDAGAYALGKRLFEERNPKAATDGLKRW